MNVGSGNPRSQHNDQQSEVASTTDHSQYTRVVSGDNGDFIEVAALPDNSAPPIEDGDDAFGIIDRQEKRGSQHQQR